MTATVAKSETDCRLSRAELRRRWEQLDDDPLIAAIPCKVELNGSSMKTEFRKSTRAPAECR